MGGGIIGASIAYHLAARGAKNVVVFEREEALGTGATAKCAGGVRLQFTTAANVAMSKLSIAALKRFEEEIGVPVDFRQNGYLFVLSDEGQLETFRQNAATQQELGVPVEVLTVEEAKRVVPEMETEDLVGATFGAEDGIASPAAILQGYSKKAKELGTLFETSVEVAAMDVASNRVQGLIVNGDRWEVGAVVNAAGPWAARVGEMAGIEIPVEPYRRMFFVTAPLSWVPDSFPMLIDWGTGVYMHKESGGMLVGESDQNEPASFSQQVDWDWLATVSEHATHRVPALSEAEIKNGVGRPLRSLTGSQRYPRPCSGAREFHLRQRIQRPRHDARSGGGPFHRGAYYRGPSPKCRSRPLLDRTIPWETVDSRVQRDLGFP